MRNPQARRNLLRALGAGGAVLAVSKVVPDVWNQPVVNAVILPAHAQTSPPSSPEYIFDRCRFDVVNMAMTMMIVSTGPNTAVNIMEGVTLQNFVARISSPTGDPLGMIQLSLDGSGNTMFMGMDHTNMMGIANDFGVVETAEINMMGDMIFIEFSFTDGDGVGTCSFDVTVDALNP